MMMRIRSWAAIGVLVLLCSSTTVRARREVDHGTALVRWLRDRGGFVNSKIVMHSTQSAGDGDDQVKGDDIRNGIFATGKIYEGEVLFQLPQRCLLRASDGEYTADNSMSICDTAFNLAREYYKGSASQFAPYVEYTLGHLRTSQAQDRHKVPAQWSWEGLSTLETILRPELIPGGTYRDVDAFRICGGENPDIRLEWLSGTLEDEPGMDELRLVFQEAYQTVITRSWNEVLVPVFDMVNHRNGRYHNADQLNSVHQTDEDIIIVALRDVEAGEQICISYNECHDTDCQNMKYEYTASNIFKDYGFVEQYPRRWRFDTHVDTPPVIFELEESIEGSGELTLTFPVIRPSPEQVEWLQWHLERLRQLESFAEASASGLESNSERESIRDYYASLKSALELAVEHLQDAEAPSCGVGESSS